MEDDKKQKTQVKQNQEKKHMKKYSVMSENR
jgi:hypothetical protein